MRRYFAFGVVGVSLLVSAISTTSVSVAFPVITSDFSISLILASWVLNVYQIVVTAGMPISGKAGDVFGRKRVFMICMVAFTAGSLLCALAPNIYFLIGARFIQAAGGAGFLPLATGIAAEEFPKSRQRAIGFFSSILPIGMLIGPILGGWLVDTFEWRSVFWLNIPVGVLAFSASIFLLKSGQKKKEGSMDLVGGGLFAGSLFALVIGLGEIGNDNNTPWIVSALLIVVAIILMIAFVRREGKTKDPMIEPRLLKEKPFAATNIYNLVFGAFLFGVISFIPLYAVSVLGMSTLGSGIVLTPRSIGQIIFSIITSMFLMRWGYRRPILVGTTLFLISLLLLGIGSADISIFGIQMSGTALLITSMSLTGIGVGFVGPAANNACIELMPHRVATITGLRGMFRQGGGAIGIAIYSIMLNQPDISHAFTLVFLGTAAFMVLTIPFVFAIPKCPQVDAAPDAVPAKVSVNQPS